MNEDFVFRVRQAEFDELYRQSTFLRADLATLREEREFLLHITIPTVQTNYLIKVGALHVELQQHQLDIAKIRRRLSVLRSFLEREGRVLFERIHEEIQNEFREWEQEIQRDAQRVDEAKRRFSSLVTFEDEKEVRALYTVLAAKLSPEINPTQGAEAKAFWPQVCLAYAMGDLFQLKALWIMALDYPETHYLPSHLSEIRVACKRLTAQIKEIRSQLVEMRRHVVFQWKALLDDPARLLREQESLRAQILEAQQQKKALMELLDSLELNNNYAPK